MDTKIITKFTVASEQGIDVLLYLTQTVARQKFEALLSIEQLENYLSENCSEKALMAEVNSMSNQWLVVYVDDQPVGFARITSKGEKPKALLQKRAIRIADFGLLKEVTDNAIRQSLFDKCWSVCMPYEAVWINEFDQNPFIDFFVSQGFNVVDGNFSMDELPLKSTCLISGPG